MNNAVMCLVCMCNYVEKINFIKIARKPVKERDVHGKKLV